MSVGSRIRTTLLPVLEALRAMGATHYVCGSVASSIHGEPRTTLDIDLVADLSPRQARELADHLNPDYYADAESMIRAVESEESFNVVHLESGLKVDVFPVKDRDFDRTALTRRVMRPLEDHSGAPDLPVASCEDTILSKLEWYRLGNEASDRQWRDVVGVLAMQHTELDQTYLTHWARRLGVEDLLEKAAQEAQT